MDNFFLYTTCCGKAKKGNFFNDENNIFKFSFDTFNCLHYNKKANMHYNVNLRPTGRL